MSAAVLMAAIALANTPASAAINAEPERVDVAYTELANGQAEAAIQKIEANNVLVNGDPAKLINLGTAQAQLGNAAQAKALFTAAAAADRLSLELSDGSWVDSRRAARMALANLASHEGLAIK